MDQRTSERGSTLLGFIAGLVVGLAVAVAVALFISNAPLPFVNKVRSPAPAAPAAAPQIDPNKSFNTAAPSSAPSAPMPPSATPQVAAPVATTAAPPAAAVSAPEASAAPAAKVEAESSRFLLQAGAFRSPEDADGMRARLAMIGLDARVYPVDQTGQTLYRVRLGPYGQLDDVNRVRKLLAENNIEAQIVRLN